MSCGVGKLVFFILPSFKGDEDAKVVLARADADARAGEFGADLIKPPGRDTGLRTMDIESGDGWMMGGLLREIREPYLPRGPALDRRGGSVRCTDSGRVYRWSRILHFPVTPKEFPECGVIWFARFALDVFQILCEPKPQYL